MRRDNRRSSTWGNSPRRGCGSSRHARRGSSGTLARNGRSLPRSRRWPRRRTRGLGFRCRGFCGLGCRFLLGQFVEMLTNQFRMREVERTGVRLFFRDADLWQVLDQHFGLDLKFPGQLVNSDLIRI